MGTRNRGFRGDYDEDEEYDDEGGEVHGESGFPNFETHWGHEPGNPGGETPPSTAGGTPAATEPRFMGSPALTGEWRLLNA
jgi:hypothetical protein